jgi:branched-chain amino acid transport system permease protein
MVAPGTYSFTRVVDMLVYAVVGGTGIFYGPVVGATFLTLLPEVLREVSSRVGLQPGPLRLFVNGLVLLLVILFLPEGISSLPGRLRTRRRARREAHAA